MGWLRRWRQRGLQLAGAGADRARQRRAAHRRPDAGADDYLIKPITIDELAARRARRCAACRPGAEVWSHGALRYDPAAKGAMEGKPVELTGREMALLEMPLLHPQRVLSRCRCRKSSTTGAAASPRAMRSRFRAPPAAQDPPGIVRTVRGVGYALGAPEGTP